MAEYVLVDVGVKDPMAFEDYKKTRTFHSRCLWREGAKQKQRDFPEAIIST